MSKAREFWILGDELISGMVPVTTTPDPDLIDYYIHTIEYSAYQALEVKLLIATDALEKLVNSEVIKAADFIGYSEAYHFAKLTLSQLKSDDAMAEK